MATDFSEVYDLFLGQIDDFELASVQGEELDFVLKRYLLNGLPELNQSMLNLNIIDFEKSNFGAELTFVEKSIVSKAMKLEWLREKLNSAELMAKSIGDRDFNSVQGYGYLKEIGNVEKELQKDVKQYVINHSYNEEYLDWVGR